jgi:hypothetical protein
MWKKKDLHAAASAPLRASDDGQVSSDHLASGLWTRKTFSRFGLAIPDNPAAEPLGRTE